MNGFYYIDEVSKQQCGPFSINELQAKNIRPNTMIWSSGMTDWAEARTVAELEFLFNPNVSMPVAPPTQGDASSPQYNNQRNGNASTPNQGMYASNVYGRNTINRGVDVRPMPKNWLIESILVTVACCLPFGIAGIVSATKVESLYYSGDYDGAEQASKDAKKWTVIGFCCTGIVMVLYILSLVIIGVASAFSL
ncbi:MULTISPECIES: CD225/dispanin family protein [unclassified Dysgonomonas]|uniref:CD225/dispanin family protein n=1 Tax=unclassified Dysgonomonas TaxID=2630389 RepID=UPI0013EB64D3|nr:MULTISPECIES: CD225/dispanin family protein [unclassified Dysgonomonas]